MGPPGRFRVLREAPPPRGVCKEASSPPPTPPAWGGGPSRTRSPPSQRQLGRSDVHPLSALWRRGRGRTLPPTKGGPSNAPPQPGGGAGDESLRARPPPSASGGEAGAGSAGGGRSGGCKHGPGKWGGGGGGTLQLRRPLPRGSRGERWVAAPPDPDPGRPFPTGLVAPPPATEIHHFGLLRPHQR